MKLSRTGDWYLEEFTDHETGDKFRRYRPFKCRVKDVATWEVLDKVSNTWYKAYIELNDKLEKQYKEMYE
jgi:hypothetical protein